jgi:DNA-binding NarL/FixJ family response regulator
MLDVMLVEDDSRFRETFARAIEASGSMSLISSPGGVGAALQSLQHLAPDVLLVDLGLPDGSGIDVIRAAAQRYPACSILVVTIYGDHSNVLASIEAGATGYLLKEDFEEHILKSIDQLRLGGSPVSPIIARQLLHKLRAQQPRSLTPFDGRQRVAERELQVLELLARGFNYREIADLMDVSKSTIETYVKRLYRKLHVNSRSEAVFEAQRLGIMA